MPFVVQPVGVGEMGVFHAKTCCPLVHLTDKFLLAAADVLRHCHTGVVAGCDHNALNHGFHILGFPFF